MNRRAETAEAFLKLVEVMARLRAPSGCPWDREQTHDSLKKYLLEESYELLEAIDARDDDAMAEECGDVLLQVVFHAQIAEEEKRFDLRDICERISEKLIRRHPHVFGDREAHDADEVLRNWEADKRKEKPERESILEGVPISLPALMQAQEIQRKARKVGFDWDRAEEAFDKVEEEWREFREACFSEDAADMKAELGDLLFAVVNISRFCGIDAEEALSQTNSKFRRRFLYIERKLKERGSSLEASNLEEMDRYWDEAKRLEREASQETGTEG